MATVNGGLGDDLVTGTSQADVITGNLGNDHLSGYGGNDTIYGNSGDDFLFGNSGDDRIVGGSGDDSLKGGSGDDTLLGGAGQDTIQGQDGDDELASYDTGSAFIKVDLDGGSGNDTLSSATVGNGQSHMWGRTGDDVFNLNVANHYGVQGHHVYGGSGSDTFNFTYFQNTDHVIVGRIDDFDPTEDVIQIDGNNLDLFNLPNHIQLSNGTFATVRIVEFNSISAQHFGLEAQQFLVIGDMALYALDGARSVAGGTERHFIGSGTNVDPSNVTQGSTLTPSEIASLQTVDYINPLNFVPTNLYDPSNLSLNYTGNGTIPGGSGADLIYVEVTSDNELSTDNRIYAKGGSDVVNGGQGEDSIWGGSGHDVIAGGLDDDVLFGGSGQDTIFGGTEDDKVYGNVGNDFLLGNSGDDSIYGGDNNDTIAGGAGQDLLWGGGGSDVFVFEEGDLIDWNDLAGQSQGAKYDSLDHIGWFAVGSDQIDLSDLSGVHSLSDLTIWRVPNESNQFVIRIDGSNERFTLTVRAEDGYSDVADASNFIF